MPTFVVPSSYGTLREFNTCHAPGGAATGGQFCSKADAANAAALEPKGYESKEDLAQYQKRWDAEREWKTKMTLAVSLGKISPKDAKVLGWSGDSNAEKGYEDLPDTLYHVSTGYNEILRHGLKTREEIGGEHRGLGGGTDDTVSFTTDLKTARTIRSAILEARRVVRGEISPAQMVRMAKAQPTLDAQTGRAQYMQSGGKRSAYEMLVSLYAGKEWHNGDPVPQSLKTVIKGVILESPGSSSIPELKNATKGLGGMIAVKDIPKGMTAYRPFMGRDEQYAAHIVRKMTAEERQSAAFEMYKRYAVSREYAGGRMDPMFFMTDAAALAKVKISDIKIMKFKPRKGTKGYKVSSLGEWRVHTGKTVRFAGVEESA